MRKRCIDLSPHGHRDRKPELDRNGECCRGRRVGRLGLMRIGGHSNALHHLTHIKCKKKEEEVGGGTRGLTGQWTAKGSIAPLRLSVR